MSNSKIISLTTDFGYKDPFVGIMKGVMLGINPLIKFVDITHEVESHNIIESAYLLGSAYNFFSSGSIHLIVVDPGVGSERAPILAISEKYCFIAPDNGVLSIVLGKEKKLDIYALEPERFVKSKISSTFHGRDIFAPAAALYSIRPDPNLLGKKVKSCVEIGIPTPQKSGAGKYIGNIVYIDRFGNLITNFSEKFLKINAGEGSMKITIASRQVKGLKSHYADAGEGEVSALINSWDNLEIFIPSASASRLLNAKAGDEVEIEF